MIRVAVSGYFDPIHPGHIEYIKLASGLGDHLIAIVNSNLQCELKKGKAFQPEEDRKIIVGALRWVDEVVIAIDKDKSVSKTLEMLQPNIFAKGGDRYTYEIPESPICTQYGIAIVDGLGKKIASSSDLTGLKEF